MKTADEFLKSKTPIERWDDHIPRSATFITKVMEDYCEYKNAKMSERIVELEKGIKKFVWHWRSYFNNKIVGNPPDLNVLTSLINDKKNDLCK